jgi:hypothetical protein
MKKKKPAPDPGKADYQATAQEKAAVGRHFDRMAIETPTPRLKNANGGKAGSIELDHPNKLVAQALLADALGMTDIDFINGLIAQLANVDSHDGEIDESKPNFLLSIVKGVKPKDQIEAMLAAQMTIVHQASLRFARQLPHTETIQQQNSAERALNKLTRTFAMQLEALKRYRTGRRYYRK